MSELDKRFSMLKAIVDKAFARLFGCDSPSEVADGRASGRYASLEEYKRKSNKRFRRTRDELDRGLSAEEAFAERNLNK
tara:strand:- start:1098 stop:1334 length:237 start_codon:yes stop_codon:yes gene_type:complete